MKILLINPPDSLDSSLGLGKEFVQKYEPLGLLYIAAILKENKYDVRVTDSYAEGLDLEGIKNIISGLKPDIIGISTLTCQGEAVFHLGRWIKKYFPEILLVLGNIHASVFADEYLKNGCCDIVVHGEGEHALLEIVRNKDIGKIEGITFKDTHGKIIKTPPRNPIDDLNKLPFPARDLLKQDLYKLTPISNQTHIGRGKSVSKTMITSRGCPKRCTFCCVHKNNFPRYNDPVKVADEIDILNKQYKADYIFIMDSLFMGNQERVLKICDEIKKRKIRINWGCPAHIHYITPESIKAMYLAGCTDISLGIESGSQRMLDKVRKGITLDEIKRAVEIIKNNSKMRIEGLFILGLPGEIYSESVKTIEFAKTLPLDMAQFSILTPYPGSQLFNELAGAGELDTGITPAGLDPSVWNRYIAYVCFTEIEPVWVTPELNSRLIRSLQKKALREFYLRPGMIIKHAKRIRIKNLYKILNILYKTFL